MFVIDKNDNKTDSNIRFSDIVAFMSRKKYGEDNTLSFYLVKYYDDASTEIVCLNDTTFSIYHPNKDYLNDWLKEQGETLIKVYKSHRDFTLTFEENN